MALVSNSLATIGVLALLPLCACATGQANAYGGGAAYQSEYAGPAGPTPARLTPPESVEGLLSSPPNDAHPGECYAKVVVPGQPIGAPPEQPHAVWVQSPPRPGQASPTWCIVYEYGVQPRPTAWTPERYGWIRVICDKDATVDRIRHIQHRLHDWGDYQGAYDGRYDDDTAHAVARFQAQRHIEHGGVLSMKTVEALDANPPLTPAYDAGHPNPNPPLAAQTYAQAVYPATIAPQLGSQPAFYAAGGYSLPCQGGCAPSPVAPPTIYAPPPQVIYAPPAPPQVVVQRVIQPIYIQPPVVRPPPPVYAEACGQPACAPPLPQPCCTGPVWGGVRGAPNGSPPYPALLTWPGKTTY